MGHDLRLAHDRAERLSCLAKDLTARWFASNDRRCRVDGT